MMFRREVRSRFVYMRPRVARAQHVQLNAKNAYEFAAQSICSRIINTIAIQIEYKTNLKLHCVALNTIGKVMVLKRICPYRWHQVS